MCEYLALFVGGMIQHGKRVDPEKATAVSLSRGSPGHSSTLFRNSMMIGTRPGQQSQPYRANKLEAVGPRLVLLTLGVPLL